MGKVFRGNFLLGGTLLFVVLVIFASGAIAFYTIFFNSGDEVTMPPLREMSITDAQAEAERLGLSVRVEQTPSSLPGGRVLGQSPEAGTRIRKGRPVVLQVSKGGVRKNIVDVRNLDLTRAQAALRDKGFDIGDIVYINDDSRPGGVVIAQSPAAPAQVPSDKRVHLLVSQGGPNKDGKIMVPDVAQMSEREARDLLATNGLKIAAVDYVYSANGTDGSVIGTRPVAGTSARTGDGVRLKVTTTKRPDGVPATAGGLAPETGSGVQVVGGSEANDTFTGEGLAASSQPGSGAQAAPVDTGVSVLDQKQARVIANPTLPNGGVAVASVNSAVSPTTQNSPSSTRSSAANNNLQPASGKIAKIRYNVPPITRPLELKIEMVDPSGTKVLLSRSVKSGERINMDVPYTKECAVTYYLGGEFVWQDKFM